MGEARIIKRYANRKLYDTERSCYVTLEEISQMIKEGDDVKVVDNKTKDDLTARIDFMAPGAPGSVPVGALK